MTDTKKKSQTAITKRNMLESLKDLSSDVTNQTGDLFKNTSEDFINELLGLSRKTIKRSGDMAPGQSLQMNEVMNGKEEENKKLRNQILVERQLSNDEKRVTQEKSSDLRVQLQALMQEVQKVASSTQNLAEATQAAAISAPVEPGVYHIIFFHNILEFLQSFRKKIDLAATWMQSSNKRAEKKNYWNMYKKKGSSLLLSPDHYSQRSAG
jgi:hypothetical protein